MVISPLSTRLIKPNFCFDLSHRRSTTVSLETRNLFNNYNYTFNLIYFTLPNSTWTYHNPIIKPQPTSITHLTCTLMFKNVKVTTHVNPKITAWSNGLMSTSVLLMCCWIFSSLNFTFAKRVSSFRATSYETKAKITAWSNGLMTTSVLLMCWWIFLSWNVTLLPKGNHHSGPHPMKQKIHQLKQ